MLSFWNDRYRFFQVRIRIKHTLKKSKNVVFQLHRSLFSNSSNIESSFWEGAWSSSFFISAPFSSFRRLVVLESSTTLNQWRLQAFLFLVLYFICKNYVNFAIARLLFTLSLYMNLLAIYAIPRKNPITFSLYFPPYQEYDQRISEGFPPSLLHLPDTDGILHFFILCLDLPIRFCFVFQGS